MEKLEWTGCPECPPLSLLDSHVIRGRNRLDTLATLDSSINQETTTRPHNLCGLDGLANKENKS